VVPRTPTTPERDGTNDSDEIRGTNDQDTVAPKAGNDDVYGRDADDSFVMTGQRRSLHDGAWDDVLIDSEAWRDTDRAFGGGGDDFVNVADGDGRDEVDYGAGNGDTVVYDHGEEIDRNCEYDPVDSVSVNSATLSYAAVRRGGD
jgi:hypothetical protein